MEESPNLPGKAAESLVIYKIDDKPSVQLSIFLALQIRNMNARFLMLIIVASKYCTRKWKIHGYDLPNFHFVILVYRCEDTTFQHATIHYLSMISAVISIPFVLTEAICMDKNDPAQSDIFSAMVFITSIVTFVQISFGSRLPVVNGVSIALLVPSLAILNQPQWRCPPPDILNAMSEANQTLLWQTKMKELSGAVVICGFVQMLLGYLGLIGIILRYISPITMATTIVLVGLSLTSRAAKFASLSWGLSLLTIALIAVFSQCLTKWRLPIPSYNSKRGWVLHHFRLFELFPVLLAVLIVWAVAAVLTAIDYYPEGSAARTDSRINLMIGAPWFKVPYPGQFGWPTYSLPSAIGMFAGTLTVTIEAVGYYATIAIMCDAPPPPVHAVNRGIGVEGVGTMLAGFWGCGNGCNIFGENVGVIGITKIGNRRVVQFVCLIMFLQSVFNKFGAVFLIIPEPIIGGIFFIMFGMIAAYGLSTLQYIDLNSPRNLFILGFSLFFALALPQWLLNNDVIKTGYPELDDVLSILLSTNTIVGGVMSCLMDNILTGTDEERGLAAWKQKMTAKTNLDGVVDDKTYDFPAGMGFINRWKFFSYIPCLPSYNPTKTA